MKQAAPKIGFDRFIALEWAVLALRVRAGECEQQELLDLLEVTHPGLAARKKTRTVLNRLWLEPRPEMVEFCQRGVAAFRQRSPTTPPAALCWGMAIATYPFFGKVAELVGRLTSLQGDCTSAEIHRRMAELYGEREGTLRMTNMVLQTQASWGAIRRSEDGKKFTRLPKLKVSNRETIAWLIEAAIRYSERPVPLSGVEALSVMFPLELTDSVALAISASRTLELRNEGGSREVVGLRDDIG